MDYWKIKFLETDKKLEDKEKKLMEELSQKTILETYKSQLEIKLNEIKDKYQFISQKVISFSLFYYKFLKE